MNIFEELGKVIDNNLNNNEEELKIDSNRIDSSEITKDEIEVANKLNAIKEFSLDRFEGEIAVLENRQTGEIKNVPKEKISEDAIEGTILNCINDKYFINESKTNEIEDEIQKKMNKLFEN